MSYNIKNTSDATELMNDSFLAVNMHFNQAIVEIDKKFGKGYAKMNPELIASFIQSAVIEYSGNAIALSIADIRDVMKSNDERFDRINDRLDLFNEDIVEIRDNINME